MKNFLLMLCVSSCFFSCRKQSYGSFQPSKFEHFEASKKNLNKEIVEIANRDSFVNSEIEQKLNVVKENLLITSVNIEKNIYRKIKIPALELNFNKSDSIKVDSLSIETSKNIRIALLSGKTLMLSIVSSVLTAFVWPYFFYLIIPSALISFISAFYIVKKVKKPYKFWPRVSIIIFSILLLFLGLVLFLFRNFGE